REGRPCGLARWDMSLGNPARPPLRARDPGYVRGGEVVRHHPGKTTIQAAAPVQHLRDRGALGTLAGLLLPETTDREQLNLQASPECEGRLGVLLACDAHQDLARHLQPVAFEVRLDGVGEAGEGERVRDVGSALP